MKSIASAGFVNERMFARRRLRVGSNIRKRLGLRGGGKHDDDFVANPGPTQLRLKIGADEPHVVYRKEGFPDIHCTERTNHDWRKMEKVGWRAVYWENKHYYKWVPCTPDLSITPHEYEAFIADLVRLSRRKVDG